MKAIATLALLGLISSHHNGPHTLLDDTPFITPSHLERVKSEVDFEVFNHDEHPFKDYSLNELKKRLGSIEGLSNKTIFYGDEKLNEDLPENFDSRTQWPGCVGAIRDQGQCGSCWAFASSGVMADRACISGLTNGYVAMSPQQLVSCDKTNYGCSGGIPVLSWMYIQNKGLVSETCYPYTSGITQETGSCMTINKRCKKDPGMEREDFITYQSVDQRHFSTIVEAKAAIVKHGPIEAAFQVYEDFMSYKSGIYVYKSGDLLGGHAIKIIGFGKEDGVEYWIVANSWTEKWGEQGYFRVAIGQRALQFESDLRAGLTIGTNSTESSSN